MYLKNLLLIPALFLGITFSGCEKAEECSCKDEPADTDYLIFGQYYGECVGDECVQVFKLTDETLYTDTIHQYPGNASYAFEELPQSKFDIANGLITLIPDSLLAVSDSTFGCPDCADQGGIIITYARNGISNTWMIDKSQNAVPEYLHDFMDSVNQTIEQIAD